MSQLPGIQERLRVFETPASSYDTSKANDAAIGILQTLGATEDLVGSVNREVARVNTLAVNAYNEKLRDQENLAAYEASLAREAAARQKEIDSELRGQAALRVNTDWADIEAQIKDGKVRPRPGESYAQAAERFTAQYLSGDEEPAYRERATEILQPKLAEAFATVTAAESTIALNDAMTNHAADFASAKTPEQMRTALEAARRNAAGKMTDTEVLTKVVLPRLTGAAEAANQKEFDAVVSMLTQPDGSVLFADKVAQQRNELTVNVDRRNSEIRGKAQAEIDAIRTQQPPAAALKAAIEARRPMLGDAAANKLIEDVDKDVADARAASVTNVQQSRVTTAYDEIRRGVKTREEFVAENERRQFIGKDDPAYMAPEKYNDLLQLFPKVKEQDEAERAVITTLRGGGPSTLSEQRHGKVFAETLQKAGVIDAGGRVQDAPGLVMAVNRAGIIPSGLADDLAANLRSTDAKAAQNAAWAAGLISASDERFYAELSDKSGAATRPLVAAARLMAEKGMFDTEAGVAQATAELSLLRQSIDAAPTLNDTQRASLAAQIGPGTTAKVLEGEVQKIVEASKAYYPQTSDPGVFNLDPDMNLDLSDPGLETRVERWLGEEFTRLAPALGSAKALDAARNYAAAKVRQSVDFVRWGGEVFPVTIDPGEGLPMPSNLRWAPGMEEEAKADLQSAGVDPATVQRVVPLTMLPQPESGDPTGNMGWGFVTTDGTLARNAEGFPLIYRPTDAQQKRNTQYGKTLAQKRSDFAATFAAPTGRLPAWMSLLGF